MSITATPQTSELKVPVGLSTTAGYGFATAVAAYLAGSGTQETLGTIIAGVIAGAAFLVTQIGRYVQARELARKPLVIVTAPDSHLGDEGMQIALRAWVGGANGARDPAAPVKVDAQ